MRSSSLCLLLLLLSPALGAQDKNKNNDKKANKNQDKEKDKEKEKEQIEEYGGFEVYQPELEQELEDVLDYVNTAGFNSTNATLVPFDGSEESDPTGGTLVSWEVEETPSQVPSKAPSSAPSLTPTVAPSTGPTATPSVEPSLSPTKWPSIAPSMAPTASPSQAPSKTPTTSGPTFTPTSSSAPTEVPSSPPSKQPTTAQPSSGPTEWSPPFQCGLCPDFRFPEAHNKIFQHESISATCIELDIMLTSTEESEECLEIMDQIGYDVDIWSYCECPGINPPGLCELCPGSNGANVPNKMVDGLFCSEWDDYAKNALDPGYCSGLQRSVGTSGTCCPGAYALHSSSSHAKEDGKKDP